MVSLRRRRLMGFTVGAAPDLPDNLHLPEDAPPPTTEPLVTPNPPPTADEAPAPQPVNPNPPEEAAFHGPNPATVINIPDEEFVQTKLLIDLNLPADASPIREAAMMDPAPSVNVEKQLAQVSNAFSGVGASNISAFSPLSGRTNAFQIPNLIRRPRSSKTLALAASKFVNDAFPEVTGALAEGDSSAKDPDYEPNSSRSGLTKKKKKQSSSDLVLCPEEKPIQVYQRRKNLNSQMTGNMIQSSYTRKTGEGSSQFDECEPLEKNSDLEANQGATEASVFSSSPNDVRCSATASLVDAGNLPLSSLPCDAKEDEPISSYNHRQQSAYS